MDSEDVLMRGIKNNDKFSVKQGKNFHNNKKSSKLLQFGTLFVALIMMISIIGVAWDIREPSGTTAGYWNGGITMISNSVGKTYVPTGYNFNQSIWDLNITGGKIDFPGNKTLELNNELKVLYNKQYPYILQDSHRTCKMIVH